MFDVLNSVCASLLQPEETNTEALLSSLWVPEAGISWVGFQIHQSRLHWPPNPHPPTPSYETRQTSACGHASPTWALYSTLSSEHSSQIWAIKFPVHVSTNILAIFVHFPSVDGGSGKQRCLRMCVVWGRGRETMRRKISDSKCPNSSSPAHQLYDFGKATCSQSLGVLIYNMRKITSRLWGYYED